MVAKCHTYNRANLELVNMQCVQGPNARSGMC